MSLIRKHGAVLQAWACLALVSVASTSVASARQSCNFDSLNITLTMEKISPGLCLSKGRGI